MDTTIKEIFLMNEEQLKQNLLQYEDDTKYTNILELKNAVIINAYNNSNLDDLGTNIVSSPLYRNIMDQNPEYEQLLQKYEKSISNPWKNLQIIKKIDGSFIYDGKLKNFIFL